MDNSLTLEDALISTPIDRLVELIKNEREVPLEYAASKIGEEVPTVEEWANILEDRGIIKIDYKLSKIILKWNEPTKKEIEERNEFYITKKQEVKQKIEETTTKLKEERNNILNLLSEFKEFKTKYKEKLDELSNILNKYKNLKSPNNEKYNELNEKIESLNAKNESLLNRITLIETNLKKIKEEFEKYNLKEKYENIKNEEANIKSLLQQMEELDNKIKEGKKKILEVYGTINKEDIEELKQLKNTNMIKKLLEINKKLDGLEKNFRDINSMKKLQKEIGLQLDKYLLEINDLEGKLTNLDVPFNKAKELIEQVESKKKALEEDLDTIKVSIEELKQHVSGIVMDDSTFKDLHQLREEIGQIKSQLNKFDKIEKIIAQLDDVSKIIDDVSLLHEKVDKERHQLAQEAGSIMAMVEDEIDTFNTFQRIKDKTLMNITKYISELDKLFNGYLSIKESITQYKSELDEALKEIAESTKEKDISEAIKALERYSKMYDKVEEAINRLNELKQIIDSMSKNIVLLNKELKLMELRNPKEIAEKLNLSDNEFNNYEKKKKELTDYLKKLWEEDSEE